LSHSFSGKSEHSPQNIQNQKKNNNRATVINMTSLQIASDQKWLPKEVEKLQEDFRDIERDILIRTWNHCEGDIDRAKRILTLISEECDEKFDHFVFTYSKKKNNSDFDIKLERPLMSLIEKYGEWIDNRVIVETWRESKHEFTSAFQKLAIMSISQFSMMEVGWEMVTTIGRETCIFMLWNILSHPKKVRYREISGDKFSNSLMQKCQRQGIDFGYVHQECIEYLYELGFQRETNGNWYLRNPVNTLKLWKWLKYFLNKHYQDYKSIFPTSSIRVLKNGKWENCEIVFDFNNRRLGLVKCDSKKQVLLETLQVGNPKKFSLEFHVDIEWINDLSYVEINETKWYNVILNKCWSFGFHGSIIDTLNPYALTLKQALEKLKIKAQLHESTFSDGDELLGFHFHFDKCEPRIPEDVNEMLLHDIYKGYNRYPQMQVTWIINYYTMIPYERTISLCKYKALNDNKERDLTLTLTSTLVNEKAQPNPFLCEYDEYTLQQNYNYNSSKPKDVCATELQKLLHEVIRNGFVCDLITMSNHDSNKIDEDEIKEKFDMMKRRYANYT
ncbi:hypothetical protein RFI_26319, partial [Reticulomyxa filosa]